MTKMTREELIAKYRMDEPPNTHNAIARAVLDGEYIGANAAGYGSPDNWLLADPDRNHVLYVKVRDAHRDFHNAKAMGALTYDTGDPDWEFDPDEPDPAVVLIHYVGRHKVGVCRRQPPRVVDRVFGRKEPIGPERGADYWLGSVQLYGEVYDLWQGDDCQLNLADDCGGRTVMFPLSFGGVVHVFRACLRCQSKAAETTATNYRFSEMMEHERATSAPLPAWARTAPWWAKWWARLRRHSRRA
jgi:hypothetical protein